MEEVIIAFSTSLLVSYLVITYYNNQIKIEYEEIKKKEEKQLQLFLNEVMKIVTEVVENKLKDKRQQTVCQDWKDK